MALEITAARPDPALLDLPWRIPLEEWPEELLAALPRGISRHVVRFVRLSGQAVRTYPSRTRREKRKEAEGLLQNPAGPEDSVVAGAG